MLSSDRIGEKIYEPKRETEYQWNWKIYSPINVMLFTWKRHESLFRPGWDVYDQYHTMSSSAFSFVSISEQSTLLAVSSWSNFMVIFP